MAGLKVWPAALLPRTSLREGAVRRAHNSLAGRLRLTSAVQVSHCDRCGIKNAHTGIFWFVALAPHWGFPAQVWQSREYGRGNFVFIPAAWESLPDLAGPDSYYFDVVVLRKVSDGAHNRAECGVAFDCARD